jgi:hypothetical protein
MSQFNGEDLFKAIVAGCLLWIIVIQSVTFMVFIFGTK